MVIDGLRGYLQLASGLTDVTRERARAAARAVVAQGGAVVPTSVQAQVSTLTEDLMATSKANRHLLVNLVRGEVERSVARLGLVSTKDMEAAERRGQRARAAGGRARGGAEPLHHGPQGREHPGQKGDREEVDGEEVDARRRRPRRRRRATTDRAGAARTATTAAERRRAGS